MFPIYDAKGKHGTLNETRYPKAGDENPKVEIGMIDLTTGETVWADFDREDDQYFGTPFWSAESDKFMVGVSFRRLQEASVRGASEDLDRLDRRYGLH